MNKNQAIYPKTHDIEMSVAVLQLPCKFNTLADSVSLSEDGSVVIGSDWAAVRTSTHVLVASHTIDVVEGTTLIHFRNGELIEGSYSQTEIKTGFTPLALAAAAMAGYVTGRN